MRPAPCEQASPGRLMKARLYLVLDLFCEKKWLARLSNRAVRVYFALLRHYNWSKGAAWPGVPTLCEETGLSERSVRYAVDELRVFGLYSVERGQGRRSNRYRLPDPVPDIPPVLFMPPRLRRRMERTVRPQTGPRRGATDCTPSRPVEVQNGAQEVLVLNNELNNERNYGGSSPSTPKAQPQEPDRERLIADHRKLYETLRNSPDAAAGIRRSLAGQLRVTEEEAATLLDGAPPSMSAP